MTFWFSVITFYVTSDFRMLSLTHTRSLSGASVAANCVSTPINQRWCRTSGVSWVIQEALWKHFYAFSSSWCTPGVERQKDEEEVVGEQKWQRGKSAPARRIFSAFRSNFRHGTCSKIASLSLLSLSIVAQMRDTATPGRSQNASGLVPCFWRLHRHFLTSCVLNSPSAFDLQGIMGREFWSMLRLAHKFPGLVVGSIKSY